MRPFSGAAAPPIIKVLKCPGTDSSFTLDYATRWSRDCSELDETVERCSQFKNNYFAEMCSGSEEGSCLRLTDFFITQL